MHPETKKLTQKNMPYLTLTENLKLQLSSGLVASYDINYSRKRSWSILGQTNTHLLIYLPRTHAGLKQYLAHR